MQGKTLATLGAASLMGLGLTSHVGPTLPINGLPSAGTVLPNSIFVQGQILNHQSESLSSLTRLDAEPHAFAKRFSEAAVSNTVGTLVPQAWAQEGSAAASELSLSDNHSDWLSGLGCLGLGIATFAIGGSYVLSRKSQEKRPLPEPQRSTSPNNNVPTVKEAGHAEANKISEHSASIKAVQERIASHLPPQFQTLFLQGIHSAEDVALAWQFLAWLNPETAAAYQICAQIPVEVSALGSHTFGAAVFKVKDGYFKTKDTKAEKILINSSVSSTISVLLILAHEARHAYYGDEVSALPSIKQDSSFTELFDSLYTVSLVDEVQAFKMMYIFMDCFESQTGLSLKDLAKDDPQLASILSAIEGHAGSYHTGGEESVLQSLRSGSYLKYKLSALRVAVLSRLNLLDAMNETQEKPEVIGAEEKANQHILTQVQNLASLLEPLLMARALDLFNMGLHPDMLQAIFKLRELVFKSELTRSDYEFLEKDFDKIVTLAGVLLGEAVPSQYLAPKAAQLADIPLHPLLQRLPRRVVDGQTPVLDPEQAKTNAQRLNLLARFKQLSDLTDHIGVKTALLALVSPEEQQGILNFLYDHATKNPPELMEVAAILAEYGYPEACQDLLQRIQLRPNAYTLGLIANCQPNTDYYIEMLISLSRHGDAASSSAFHLACEILTNYINNSAVSDFINDFAFLNNCTDLDILDQLEPLAKTALEKGEAAFDITAMQEGFPTFRVYDSTLRSFCFEKLYELRLCLEKYGTAAYPAPSQDRIGTLTQALRQQLTTLSDSQNVHDHLRQRIYKPGQSAQPPIETLKVSCNKLAFMRWSDRTAARFNQLQYENNLECMRRFSDVVDFLGNLNPTAPCALHFSWVCEHWQKWNPNESEAREFIRIWDQWLTRANVFSARFNHSSLIVENGRSQYSSPATLKRLPSPSNYLSTPEGLQVQVHFAQSLLTTRNPFLMSQAREILVDVENTDTKACWWDDEFFTSPSSYLVTHSRDVFIAQAWYLEGTQGSGQTEALIQALQLLNDQSGIEHKISYATERLTLLYDLALEFYKRGRSDLQQRCKQLAHDYAVVLSAHLDSPDAFIGRDNRDGTIVRASQSMYDRYKSHIKKTNALFEARYEARLRVLSHPDQTDDIDRQFSSTGPWRDYTSEQLLAMAGVFSQAQRFKDIKACLSAVVKNVEQRKVSDNAWDWILGFSKNRNASYVGLVLDSQLSPSEKDTLILAYAQAALGQDGLLTDTISPNSLSQLTQSLKPLLNALKQQDCPLTELFLFKRLDEILKTLATGHPNIARTGIEILYVLIRQIEAQHPELIDPEQREQYLNLDPENEALKDSVSILYPLSDRASEADLDAEISNQVSHLHRQAMQAFNDKITQRDNLDRNKLARKENVFLRLADFLQLESYARLDEICRLHYGAPFIVTLSGNAALVRRLCGAEPHNSMRAQMFHPLLVEVYKKTNVVNVKAAVVDCLSASGMLGGYAKKQYQDSQQRETFYQVLDTVLPYFNSPIPDEIFALFSKDPPLVDWKTLTHPDFLAHMEALNRIPNRTLGYWDGSGLTPSRDPKAAKLILAVFAFFEAWYKQYPAAIIESGKALRIQAQVEVYQRTTVLPDAIKKLPETLQFVMTVFFFQNPDFLPAFKAHCREYPQESAGELLRFLFQITHAEKLAQVLANWPGLLDPEIQAALTQTQEDNTPVPQEQFLLELNRNLGANWQDVFFEIDWDSRKVGSVAEVVRARLKATGEWVAIKILIPSRQEHIHSHLRQMRELFDTLSLFAETHFAGINPKDFAKEYIQSYELELDLGNEHYNATRMKIILEGQSQVRIPRYFSEPRTENFLMMSWEQGRKLDSTLPLQERKKAVKALWTLAIRSIFQSGLVLDDLHTGNLRWDTSTGQLIVWDMGRMTKIEKQDTRMLIEYLQTIKAKNSGKIFKTLAVMSKNKLSQQENQAIQLRIEQVLQNHPEFAELSTIDQAQYLLGVVGRNQQDSPGLILDSRFTMLVKTLLTLQTVSKLDPSFNVEQALQEYITIYLKQLIFGG